MEKQYTIRIGISMAGAISAGAYTAGVMDYLLEALENWQRAKDLGVPGVPKHNVVIEVLSGASAGGMTAVIASAAIQKEFPHVNQKNYSTGLNKDNPIFDSWVNLTDEPGNDMMTQMLGNSDITGSRDMNPDREVRSLFNSLFIEKIARRTLDNTVKSPGLNRPYFADDLELLTTITNLRGFNYEMQFKTALGIRDDHMTMHKDMVHFQLDPSGTYKNDGKIPFHFDTVQGFSREMLIDAAIATGAFPAGLSPRVVIRDPKYINDNPLLKITHGKDSIIDSENPYNAVCVDGGVINNEPYDLTETILTNRRKAEIEKEQGLSAANEYQLKTNAADFDTTVLMIDPFPNYDEKPADEYYSLTALKYAVLQLFGAMRQQLMIKTELLEQVYNTDDYSRFMIAPIRTKNGETQEFSIACGSLGGFGGFFNKQFRIHDYFLGRRNCQRFIQQYFCVPVSAKNPVFDYGYKNIDTKLFEIVQNDGKIFLPIIPDIRISFDEKSISKPGIEEEFPYPSISLKYLLSLEKKIQNRIEAIFDNVLHGNDPGSEGSTKNKVVQRIRKKSWLNRNVFSPIAGFTADKFISIGKWVLKEKVAEKFIDTVIADMDKRGLLNQDC